jgi:hypothetical protein
MINNRKGTNWILTADIASDDTLDAEYILDGKTIKLDSNATKAAAEAVARDIVSDLCEERLCFSLEWLAKPVIPQVAWDPYADGNEVTIEDNPCKWKIVEPESKTGGNSYRWAPQVTAPLPLSSLYDLLGKYIAGTQSALLPKINQKPMVQVTKDFFQSKPNGLDSGSVEEDVLGFFSLVLSFAKAPSASPEEPIIEDESLKELTIIMPRTDFTSIYSTVKSAIPGDLYPIVRILGCYKNTGNSVE